MSGLCKKSEEWQMLFNADKCHVMHFGYNNPKYIYTINCKTLEVIAEEKDLVVVVQSNLKVSAQCSKVVKSGNKILGMIKQIFLCRDKYVILNLYKSLIRPHLEYCVQVYCVLFLLLTDILYTALSFKNALLKPIILLPLQKFS